MRLVPKGQTRCFLSVPFGLSEKEADDRAIYAQRAAFRQLCL